jgi:hypothetical protein
MTKSVAEIVRDKLDPNGWRVEQIDSDGAIEVAIFSGPNAKKRAVHYNETEYPSKNVMRTLRRIFAWAVFLGGIVLLGWSAHDAAIHFHWVAPH